MKRSALFFLTQLVFIAPVWSQTAEQDYRGGIITMQSSERDAQNNYKKRNWVDDTHNVVSDNLDDTAKKVNNWFGEEKKHDPAKASLRLILDNNWNKYDGYSIKPRVRGRVKLPALQDRFHLVFGDETVENEFENVDELQYEQQPILKDGERAHSKKALSLRKTRQDNASLGLQWLLPDVRSWHGRVGLGLRSNGDLYSKLKLNKKWEYSPILNADYAFLYRYGLKSKHYVRNNFTISHKPVGQPETSNQLRIEYRHNGEDESWTWGNSFSRNHPRGNDTWYNYGLYVGGDINSDSVSVNSYGPFVGMRKNFYRKWIYFQPEITYYNNEALDRPHHIGLSLRLEAQF